MQQTWREATQRALYGTHGFYVREAPAAHFRTSSHLQPFAQAVLALARRHGIGAVIDLGAGGGELLTGLHALDPALALHGVELRPRPQALPAQIEWSGEVPAQQALLVANEWLDTVPVDVVELTADGLRLVLVDDAGDEVLGDPPQPQDLDWLERWWPLGSVGDRAEVGHPRDAAWSAVLQRLRPGSVALAVDYGHLRAEREAGAYASGTLRAHRAGRLVPAVPDGSCDITSAVALDSVRATGEAVGAVTLALTDQRAALTELLPEPVGLRERLEQAELRDAYGLGGFGWLLQRVPTAQAGTDTLDPGSARS